VTPGRYATMTGRGRDNTMYGQERYIDAPWHGAQAQLPKKRPSSGVISWEVPEVRALKWENHLYISCYISGKRSHNYGKSQFFMGKLTINGHVQ